ncbi:hypothetical protein CNMCM5793_008518 [Aspergillus hiratsukae]|uniref:GP-PDE domain-containing protein n=1 Tax=Aspergillus hiratsukae TaxID=1194566 RepID=A0A8H6P7S1_9EURO|nr:hypothetical protein CNMCM5793_008518 [Aspergillus hiratsukae]
MTPPARPQIQTIAHRGKTKHPASTDPRSSHFPENTLESFRAAAAAGCDAIETDLRVSRDGVIVLCHDRSLERVYGDKRFVDECSWEELQSLRSVQAPYVAMPRLVDFLALLCEPGWEGMWVLLDIKIDTDRYSWVISRSGLSRFLRGRLNQSRPLRRGRNGSCWGAGRLRSSRCARAISPVSRPR